MKKNQRPVLHFALITISVILLVDCKNKNDSLNIKAETKFAVYGSYTIYRLPIDKGVTILNPIFIKSGPGGRLYAGNQTGEIYSLFDSNGDGFEDEAQLYTNVADFGLKIPAGFAHKGDTVFIGTSQEIRAFIDKDGDFKADTSWTFFNKIPYSVHPYEYTSALSFDAAGWLYFALATDSWNDGPAPDPYKYRGSILKISPDGKEVIQAATGIRSVHGSVFDKDGNLFFTDNQGGGNLNEELNILIHGKFYGHNPVKYNSPPGTTEAIHHLNTEVAPSGMDFNYGDKFGDTYGDLFVAFYGPGERWNRGGITGIKFSNTDNNSYKLEEYPVADIPKLSYLCFGKNGDLYVAHHGVSDYWYYPTKKSSGGFYKIVYDPMADFIPREKRKLNNYDFSDDALALGKQLFAERACSACHSINGKEELIGPDLKAIGSRLSRAEILEEIKEPSKIIKSGMHSTTIQKKNGQVLFGRIVYSDDQKVSLMIIGNQVIDIPMHDIAETKREKNSLMYENLLGGLSENEINSLLDYMISL